MVSQKNFARGANERGVYGTLTREEMIFELDFVDGQREKERGRSKEVGKEESREERERRRKGG